MAAHRGKTATIWSYDHLERPFFRVLAPPPPGFFLFFYPRVFGVCTIIGSEKTGGSDENRIVVERSEQVSRPSFFDVLI